MNEIIMYCLQTNKIIVYNNDYNLPVYVAVEVIRLGLKDKYTLEYIGEL